MSDIPQEAKEFMTRIAPMFADDLPQFLAQEVTRTMKQYAERMNRELRVEIIRLRSLCGEAAFRGQFHGVDEWIETDLIKASKGGEG